MKRFLTIGLVIAALTAANIASGQNKRVYDDDIYYNSKTAEQERTNDESQSSEQYYRQDENYSSGGNDNRGREDYEREFDYVNYDDEYYYATHLNQFYHPFYNRPYWSAFYNPYWYGPYWSDPYWGWNPWMQPGFSVSFGYGPYPYWNSYWGWSSWYGGIAYNSYFSWGLGIGYSYGGYWPGYYYGNCGGFYNNGYYPGHYRAVTYGPRYSMDATRNNYVHRVGTHAQSRQLSSTTPPADQTLNANTNRTNTFRATNENAAQQMSGRDITTNGAANAAPARSGFGERVRNEIRSLNSGRSSEAVSSGGGRWTWNNNAGEVQTQASAEAAQPRRDRGGLFGSGNTAPSRGADRATFDRSYSQPRFEQRSSPAPRMASPSPGFNQGGGSRSFGGSNMGGGSFGGGNAGMRGRR